MPRRKRLETDAALDERALERRLKAFRQWIAASREADAFRQVLRDRLVESRERVLRRRVNAQIARDLEERGRQSREQFRRENRHLYRGR